MPLGRSIRQIDRTIPRLHGRAGTRTANAIVECLAEVHAVPHLPLPLEEPPGSRSRPVHAVDWTRLAYRKKWFDQTAAEFTPEHEEHASETETTLRSTAGGSRTRGENPRSRGTIPRLRGRFSLSRNQSQYGPRSANEWL